MFRIIVVTFSSEVVFLGVHLSYIFVQNQAIFSALIKSSAVIYNPIVGGRERKRENIIARAVWCGANWNPFPLSFQSARSRDRTTLFGQAPKNIHPKYYKDLKKAVQLSHLVFWLISLYIKKNLESLNNITI